MKTKRVLAILSICLSVSCFYLTIDTISTAIQTYQAGILDLFLRSLVFGVFFVAVSLVCAYLSLQLLETKILRETYFFVLFVFLFSTLGHIVLNIVFDTSFPYQWLITISVIIGTPISCMLAGYSQRTFQRKLTGLVSKNGITFFTLFVLASMPIIEIIYVHQMKTLTIPMTGRITQSPLVFESSSDTEKVQGIVSYFSFTAEMALYPNIMFEARQIVDIANKKSSNITLRPQIESFSGNVSKVNQLEIFFTHENGTESAFLNITNGTLVYDEVPLNLESYETASFGIVSLTQDSTDITIISLSLKLNSQILVIAINITD